MIQSLPNKFLVFNTKMYIKENSILSTTETSPDEIKTETIELSSSATSDSYGSIAVKDKSVSRFYVPFCGLVFYVLAFFGLFCSSLLREGLNVAIVAMVNRSAVIGAHTVTTNVSDNDQCPKEPEIKERAGTFNWNPTQEAILLAAFYYGYGVTQVFSIKTYCIGKYLNA